MSAEQVPHPRPTDLGSLTALPVVPASEFLDWQPEGASPPEPPPARANDMAPPSGLNDAEMRYLRAVIGHPGQISSAYPKLASLSPAKAAVVRQRLAEGGFLRLHEVATGRRGRNAIVVEPTEAGCRAIKRLDGGES